MSGRPGNCTVPKDFQQVLNRVQKAMLGRGTGGGPQPQQEVAPQQQQRGGGPQQQRGGGPGRGGYEYDQPETFRSFLAMPGGGPQRGGGSQQRRGGGPGRGGYEYDQSELVELSEEWGADKEVRPTGRQDADVPAKGGANPGPRSGVFTGASRGLDQRQVKQRVAYTPPHGGREKGFSEEDISDGEKERRESQKREYRVKK